MAQTGRLVVCGDAGDALGDSIYEARIYVRGKVAGLGADCVEKELGDEHRKVKDYLDCGRKEAFLRPAARAVVAFVVGELRKRSYLGKFQREH